MSDSGESPQPSSPQPSSPQPSSPQPSSPQPYQDPQSPQPYGDPQSPQLSAFSARVVALLEVLLCSGYPTQIALGGTFVAFGFGPFDASGDLTVRYVVGVTLLDTAMVVGLVLFFLWAHGERPRDVILGRQPLSREAAFGVPLIFAAVAVALTVLLAVQRFAPVLHTVEKNPLQSMLGSPRDALLFAFVVVVAGGVREEIQRAFMLRRIETWLGGATTAVVVTSIAFGAGHVIQGADAMVATGLLGAMWAVVYLRRRSAVAPMVSHAGFDLLQVVPFLVARGS